MLSTQLRQGSLGVPELLFESKLLLDSEQFEPKASGAQAP
jgi:hypothetical protein